MPDTYRYKAFISYRHLDFDKKMAEKLQRKLENYKPPKGVAPQEKWKVFRDETELSTNSDLSGKIKEALESSEYLIVVCSESLKKSKWCMEEIDHFKALHNGSTDHIIPFIVSGTPEEVFPAAILTSAVPNPETGELEQQPVEPLAANIAAGSEREAVRRFKTEFFRIAAPMLSCSFDSLFHRERKRRRRKTRAIAAAVLVAVSLFSIYSTAMMMKISSQNVDLEQKNSDLSAKTHELTEANNKLDKTVNELDERNVELKTTNSRLTETQKSLEDSNAQLTTSNKELDEKNAELTTAKKEIEDSNAQLTTTNNQLTEAQKSLEDSNAQLTTANSDLDKSNKSLAVKTQEALDNLAKAEEQEQLAKEAQHTAEENEQQAVAAKQEAENNAKEAQRQRKNAEDNAEEAKRQRQIAEENEKKAVAAQKEAESNEQKAVAAQKLAEENEKKAVAAQQEAEENYKEAERQRQIAEQNLADLKQANADLTAEKANKQFSERYDRIGAIETLYSTPLYQDDNAELKPSARLFLNKVLYSFCPDSTRRLQKTLDAETAIVDFTVSTDLKYVLAYDTINYVYVFDYATGNIVYKNRFGGVYGVAFSDNSHICVVNMDGVYSISFASGAVEWFRSLLNIYNNSHQYIFNAAFSADKKRVAVWTPEGWFAFLTTDTGTMYYTCKASLEMTTFVNGNTTDFSDGVHLHATGRLGNEEYYFSIDAEAKTIKIMFIGTDQIYAAHHIENTGSGVVRYIPESAATVFDICNPNGKRIQSLPLYNRLLKDAAVQTVFTAKDGNQYAVVTGVQLADRQPMLYLINLTTAEIIRAYATPSPIKLVSSNPGGDILGIFTAQGAEYGYRISDNYCKLNRVLSDNQTMNADGSRKIVCPSNWLTLALAENSSRIMIYESGYGDNSTGVSNGNRPYNTMVETNNYIAAESAGAVLVYDKNTKALKRKIPISYGISQIKAFEINQIAIVSNDNNHNTALHIIDLTTGQDSYLTIGKYSAGYPDSSNASDYYWNLLVSADKNTLAVVNKRTMIWMRNGTSHMINFNTDAYAHFQYGLTALSPDGTKLAKVSLSGDNKLTFAVMELENSETYNMLRLPGDEENLLDLGRTRVSFSPDSNHVVLAYGKNAYIFNTGTARMFTAINSASPIHSVLLDNTSLYVLTETSRLEKYNLQTNALEQSLNLPDITDLKNVDAVTMMLNPTRNELLVYTNKYACFIDITAMEMVAEAKDEFIIGIMGFLPSKQELVIQKELDAVELRFYPNYTAEELAARSRELMASYG